MVTSKRDFGFLSTGTVAGLLAGAALSYVFLTSVGNTEPVIEGTVFAPGKVELATLKTTYPREIRVYLDITPTGQRPLSISENIFKDASSSESIAFRDIQEPMDNNQIHYYESFKDSRPEVITSLAKLRDDQTVNFVRLMESRQNILELVPEAYLKHGVQVINCLKPANETNMQCSLVLK